MKALIIIPCYNEENRLQLQQFDLFLTSEETEKIHFLFVNDGSTDKTLEVLQKFQQKNKTRVDFLDLEQNMGKAEAIRQGMMLAQKGDWEYLGYFDADLATPLTEIPRLMTYTSVNNKPFIIMGSRIKLLGSTDIQRKLRRHYIGRVFATIVSNLLKMPIYDTQCGAKMIRKDISKAIFKEPFISKWLFDVELLFRIKRSEVDLRGKIIEIPLKKWEDVAGSKIGLIYFLKAPIDLLKIYLHYK